MGQLTPRSIESNRIKHAHKLLALAYKYCRQFNDNARAHYFQAFYKIPTMMRLFLVAKGHAKMDNRMIKQQ